MRPALYETLRALVCGMLLGLLASVPLMLALRWFGPAGLFCACGIVATGAFAAGCILERRARRASNGERPR